ncbi:glutaredoxin family protein [Candidatus Uhrbacteria bacterium]|nr:glutaredoxin family protein [Candidatus Uhrbacteria bacterium]
MNIILYTKAGCPWCDEVRSLFQQKGVVFQERECRNNQANFDELVKKSGQTLTPTLDIDGEIIADTDARALSTLFKERDVPGF